MEQELAGSAAIAHLHGRALDALDAGDAATAIALLTEALGLEPERAIVRLDLARALAFANRRPEALAQYDRVLERQPNRAEAHAERADLLLDLGQRDEAMAGYRQAVALRPEHRHAAHMLASLAGTHAGADQRYVAGLYDAYAAQFESHLRGDLGYDIPAGIRRALDKIEGLHPPLATLDVGCGTGLVAAALDGVAGPIDGIDISPAMVEQARRRRYRNLAVGDLTATIGTEGFAGPYDLVTAADVFIHVPDLAPVFAAVTGVLARSGLFAFSTERTTDAAVSLRSTGRYAQSVEHIRDLAAPCGLEVVVDQPVTVRHERLQPVPGQLFVLRCTQPSGQLAGT